MTKWVGKRVLIKTKDRLVPLIVTVPDGPDINERLAYCAAAVVRSKYPKTEPNE